MCGDTERVWLARRDGLIHAAFSEERDAETYRDMLAELYGHSTPVVQEVEIDNNKQTAIASRWRESLRPFKVSVFFDAGKYRLEVDPVAHVDEFMLDEFVAPCDNPDAPNFGITFGSADGLVFVWALNGQHAMFRAGNMWMLHRAGRLSKIALSYLPIDMIVYHNKHKE